VVAIVVVATKMVEKKEALIDTPVLRRLTLLDEATLIRTVDFDVKKLQLVHLWDTTPFLNSCLVNLTCAGPARWACARRHTFANLSPGPDS
jgi:hypothetical protein